MRTSVPQVPLRRTVVSAVAQFMRKQKFELASCTGVIDAYSRSRPIAVGILRDEVIPPYTTWWRFLLIPQHRRQFIGILHFECTIKGTDHRTWVIDVFGLDNLDVLRRVASEMSEAFDKVVRCRLADEASRLEDFV